VVAVALVLLVVVGAFPVTPPVDLEEELAGAEAWFWRPRSTSGKRRKKKKEKKRNIDEEIQYA
ncbi:MAG: hypothetical protein ACI8RD_012463, partial [Bacillariaceae sp.]|jgi:hypothetical protein